LLHSKLLTTGKIQVPFAARKIYRLPLGATQKNQPTLKNKRN